METPFDWITVLVFTALTVLYLQRSAMDDPPDKVWHYLPPALGCALANYIGNEGYAVASIALVVGVMAYIHFVLRPFRRT